MYNECNNNYQYSSPLSRLPLLIVVQVETWALDS
jgi:hypothetical protein